MCEDGICVPSDVEPSPDGVPDMAEPSPDGDSEDWGMDGSDLDVGELVAAETADLDDTGCGCRQGTPTGHTAGWLLAALLVVMAVLPRRGRQPD